MRLLSLCIMLTLTIFLGEKWLTEVLAATPSSLPKPLSIQACHTKKQFKLPQDLSQIMRSVVIVQNKANIGSGVIISEEGYILTAAHLVHKANQAAVYLNTGNALPAKVIRVDKRQDIALLKAPDNHYQCLPMMTMPLPIGSPIFSLGFSLEKNNGFLLKEGKIQNRGFNPTNGTFYVQTNLDLKPGHSGGPLLSREGQVAGIINWKIRFSNSRVYSFGTPISTMKPPMQISLKN